MEHGKIIYQVAVSGLHCRSSRELVNLKITALEGVEAASIGVDDTLRVFADGDLVMPGDIIRTLVDVGVAPRGEISLSTPAVTVAVTPESTPAVAAEAPAAVETEAPAPQTPAAQAEQPAAITHERELAPVAHAAAHQPVALEAETPMLRVPVATTPAPSAEPPALARDDTAVTPELAHFSAEESIQAAMETPAVDASPRASLVQRIQVAVSDNYYPNRIDVIPGVPVEIEFGEGHGCLARVLFEQFDIDQDLTHGGAVVRLPGLAPGVYEFSCGMHMVFGTVMAEA